MILSTYLKKTKKQEKKIKISSLIIIVIFAAAITKFKFYKNLINF
jgi:hypothetical protein